MRGGVEHFGISKCMGGGGGKISMPPVVGVQIFSGTTHCNILHNIFKVRLCLYS